MISIKILYDNYGFRIVLNKRKQMTVVNDNKKDKLIKDGVKPKKAYHLSHTHLNHSRIDFDMGKEMVKNIVYQRKPRKKSHRELRENEYLEYIKSHIRLVEEGFYKDRIERFLIARKDKSNNTYINIGVKSSMRAR